MVRAGGRAGAVDREPRSPARAGELAVRQLRTVIVGRLQRRVGHAGAGERQRATDRRHEHVVHARKASAFVTLRGCVITSVHVG